jgi:hypothetical protein
VPPLTRLDIDILEVLVEVTVATTYLIHCEVGELDQQVKDNLLMSVGLIKRDLRSLPYPYEFWPVDSYNANDSVHRILLMEQIRNWCTELNLLLNNVRNETIGFQVHFRKWKTNAVTGMKKNLENLKRDYVSNFAKIEEAEWKLNLILDNE